MVKITIENLGEKEVVFNDQKTTLGALQQSGVDWMHACGGKGRCTTCKMIIISGGENLSAMTKAEIKFQTLGLLARHERLACQATPHGNVTIRVAEAYKLPHVSYSF
jgi:2Fe-2S ferredoxin